MRFPDYRREAGERTLAAVEIDTALAFGPAGAARAAEQAEAAGYDGVWTNEGRHDPFLPLVVAAGATHRVAIGTAVALAFTRDPATTATVAYDLHLASRGRFILGLGGAEPAALRDYVVAVRASWDAWDDPFGTPRIFVGGPGAQTAEVAGEVADGYLCPPFTTAAYFHDVLVPALARGRDRAAREGSFEVSGPSLLVTGATEAEMARAAANVRRRLALLATDPANRPVLDHHRWSDLHDSRIDDEVIAAFAVVGEPEEIGPALRGRYGETVDRISIDVPYSTDPARWRALTASIKNGARAA